MARNRKSNGKGTTDSHAKIDIPEEEQWRLIEQTGLLKKVASQDQTEIPDELEEEYPLAEEIFQATTLIIPMSFLLLMMHMCVVAVYFICMRS